MLRESVWSNNSLNLPSVIEIDFPPLIDPIDEKLDQAKWGDLRGKELKTAVDDAYL